MNNSYHFVTRWRVKARAGEVWDIISQAAEYPRWWPSVYLEVREITHGGAGSTGRRFQAHTKGWLPYTLRWEFTITEAISPSRLVIEATGDFNGRGIWSFVQDDDYVDISFDWKLTADKAMLRYLTPVMRPVFEANHRWAMEQGEISLRQELIRYRARVPEDLLEAAEPPGPVEVPVRWIAAGALAASALAFIALARRKSRKNQAAPA
jgi:hypothetical protein